MAVVGCGGERAAEERLAADGYTEISVSARNDGAMAFTAVKDGQSCEGTVSTRNVLSFWNESQVSSHCVSATIPDDSAPPAPVERAKPTQVELPPGLDVAPRGLGEAIVFDGFGRGGFTVEIEARDDDPASQAATALLIALQRNAREWIAGHGTPKLRRDLLDVPANINGPIIVFRHIEIGTPRVESQDEHTEVVVFPLVTEPAASSFTLRVTFEDGAYAAFEISGAGWDEAIDAYHRTDRFMLALGAWAYTDADGVLPDRVARPGDEVKVVFVYDRFRVREGTSLAKLETTHVKPNGKEHTEPERALEFEATDDPLLVTTELGRVGLGRHEVNCWVGDYTTPNSHSDSSTHYIFVEKPRRRPRVARAR